MTFQMKLVIYSNLLVINSNLSFISHRFRDPATQTQNFPFKIAAKPLQMETVLLLDSL